MRPLPTSALRARLHRSALALLLALASSLLGHLPALPAAAPPSWALVLTNVNDPRLGQLPDLVRSFWKVERTANGVRLPNLGLALAKADLAQNRAEFRQGLRVVRAMRRAGVRLLAGTDASVPYCFPGSGLHDELELLVRAGLSPLEALQTATHNPAELLGRRRDLGTAERGKFADLVLLEANPLDNIRNTRRIAAVVLDGRLLDRATLDRILDAAEKGRGR
jgi:hypothetical protein